MYSGLVESNGQSEWVLFSVVNNSQRGSQERMISKLRYTVDFKLPAVLEARQGNDERDRLKVEKLEAEKERDRARVEKRKAEVERDKVRVEKWEVEVERDRARVEKWEAEVQSERMRVEKLEAEGESDKMRVELQQAQERADELQRRLDELEKREDERSILQHAPSWDVKEDELEVRKQTLAVGSCTQVRVEVKRNRALHDTECEVKKTRTGKGEAERKKDKAREKKQKAIVEETDHQQRKQIPLGI